MITDNLTQWLSLILQERIHSQIDVRVINGDDAFWEISIPGSSLKILLPVNPCFYKLGAQTKLPITTWKVVIDLGNDHPPSFHAPGMRSLAKPLIKKTATGFTLDYDILGLIYWMLGRCEEIRPEKQNLDAHQRFDFRASHPFQNGYLEEPVVDQWILVLRHVVKRTWHALEITEPQYRISVSHDVDLPSKYGFFTHFELIKRSIRDCLRKRSINDLTNLAMLKVSSSNPMHKDDPFNTFDWIMRQSERLNLKSAFYFICGRTSPKLDAPYEVEHPAIRSLLRKIHRRGHEVGLHPSYNTFQNPAEIVAEANRLRAVAEYEQIQQTDWGGRMHFLRWEWPTTATGWSLANVNYDSTLGFAGHSGFRCGTCHEYPMFDPIDQKQLNIRQRPLIVMESSIIADHYSGYGYSEQGLRKVKKLKDRCRSVQGNFTLLWHNNHFTTAIDRDTYQEWLVI